MEVRSGRPGAMALAAVLALATVAAPACAVVFPMFESGKPIPAASFDGSELGFDGKSMGGVAAPLSVGMETKPIGVAYVFKKEMPDVFIMNDKMSTEPGLYLYEFMGLDDKGVPMLRRRVQVTHPFKGLLPPTGTIVQVGEEIHGFFHVENNIMAHTRYDRANHGLVERRELHVQGLPRPPVGMAYLPRATAGGDLILEVADRKAPVKLDKEKESKTLGYQAPSYNPHDSEPDYNPKDGGGIWKGGWPHSGLYSVRLMSFIDSPSQTAHRVTTSDHNIQFGYCGLTGLLTNATGDKERSLITGSYYGVLYYFRNMADSGIALRARQPVTDKNGVVLRHPTPKATPMVYPGKKKGEMHLLVGGEGAVYFYKFKHSSAEQGGVPSYDDPQQVTEVGGSLYGGSHPSPNAVDWDGDGRTDLVVGNAEGRVLFLRNAGTNRNPAFLSGAPLKAGGEEIHVQPGYAALQGPAEARYGYTAPTVVDWDGDGLLDVLMSDARAVHTVYMNRGKPGRPKLARGQPLYNDGLEVHGPWRVKPGVSRVNGRMAYVVLDDADEFHAYYRIDDYNVKDAGKVRLRTGKPIKSHFLSGAATGRIHIALTDWDLDGVVDLLVAAPRHASLPEPDNGLPRSLGLPGGAILFMRGKREAPGELPRFRYPEVLHYDGSPIFIGREDGSLAVLELGEKKGPHLLVAEEGGHFVYYERKRMSCESYNRFPEGKARGSLGGSGSTQVEQLHPISRREAISGAVGAAPDAAGGEGGGGGGGGGGGAGGGEQGEEGEEGEEAEADGGGGEDEDEDEDEEEEDESPKPAARSRPKSRAEAAGDHGGGGGGGDSGGLQTLLIGAGAVGTWHVLTTYVRPLLAPRFRFLRRRAPEERTVQ